MPASQGSLYPCSSSGFLPSPGDPGSLFFHEFDDSHITVNLSEFSPPGVADSCGDLSWQLFPHDEQSALKAPYNPDWTSGTEDAPAALAIPAASHELASDITTSQPLLPGHSSWKASTQTNPLRTSSANKRKALALDEDESNGCHSYASEARYGGAQHHQNNSLACPFYKMNPKRYMSCGERSISNISALGQHLRNAHKLKPLHCKDCFESFDEKVSLQRHKEPGACVPTGGCSVDDLCGLRGKRKGTVETWYWYWKQLFPTLDPPSSPHTDGLEVVGQCMLSAIQRVIIPLELETCSKTNLILGLFSEMVRWRQHPAAPLDHAQLQQYSRLPASPAGSWQEGPRQPTPIRVS